LNNETDGDVGDFMDRLKLARFEKNDCEDFHSKILGDRLLGSTPYFYPFIVEFALIGASVAFIMSNHIGKRCGYIIRLNPSYIKSQCKLRP
jgi:hypothetical protein